jgi:LacI family transcriptional regulator
VAPGLPLDDSYVIHAGERARGTTAGVRYGGWRYGANASDGYQAARVLFRRHSGLSLLFCGTDRMAMGAYDYLKETGRRIPQDVAVVGFDNQLLIAGQVRPPLTTIALPHYEMGRQAVRLALGHSDGADEADGSGPRQVALPCRLVRRKSA